MSPTAATATVTEAPPAAAGKGKKKLLLIVAAALLVVLAGGGTGAFLLLKKKPVDVEAEADAAADADAEPAAPVKAAARPDPKQPPVFVPLEPFTVNLADRDAERYAQIGITLEIDDAKTGEQIKLYMPAIRNNILMAIADRSAGELMGREGKAQLAERVKRETSRALGYDVGDEPDDAAAGAAAKTKPKARKKAPAALPVRAVHFSNFIIQ